MSKPEQERRVRLDKWLWAARFFKTRALASEAVSGGKVHRNGERVKPAQSLKIGDQLRIHRGGYEFVIEVTGLAEKRGSAKIAATLFAENEASIAARQALAEQRRIEAASRGAPERRPNKRDRRHIVRFTRKGE